MRTLKTEEMELVAGGGHFGGSTKHGNNGWGNGGEGENAGSDNGPVTLDKQPDADGSGDR